MRSYAGATGLSPSMSMCPAVLRRPKRSCTASFSFRKRSSAPAQSLGRRDLTVSERTDALASQIDAHLSGRVRRVASLNEEVTYEVEPSELLSVCRALRDTPELRFEMLMDVAGVDYLHFGRDEWQTETATRSGFSRGRVSRTTAPDPNL